MKILKIQFPTETEFDFDETLDFIIKVHFNDITLIPYSDFSMCESSKISEKIEEKIKYERMNKASSYLKQNGIKIRS